MKASEMQVGAVVTVPHWRGTFEGGVVELHNVKCTVTKLNENTFMADIDKRQLNRTARMETLGRIIVAYRAVGVKAAQVRGLESNRQKAKNAMWNSIKPRAKAAKKREPGQPRNWDAARTAKSAATNSEKWQEIRAQSAVKLKEYYSQGLTRFEVSKLEHWSPTYMGKVEREFDVKRPEFFRARTIDPDGTERYFETAVMAKRHLKVTRVQMREHMTDTGVKIEAGYWTRTKTGFREVKK